jgi:hypothetical protein
MVFWEVLFSRHLITHKTSSIPFRKIRLISNFDLLAPEGTELGGLTVSQSARSMSIFVNASRSGLRRQVD